MRAILSILIGVVIIYISYYVIKKEIDRAIVKSNIKYAHIDDDNTKEILLNLDNMENTVNEINRSFYELISDLEGKFSIHDKEIQILNEKLDEKTKYIEKNIAKISTEINEGKKSIYEISNSQKNNDILVKSVVEKNIDVAKKIEQANQPNSLNINSNYKSKEVIGKNSDDISNMNFISKKGFVESLNDVEKEKLRDNIIELRHKGFSINQIAKKLNVGVGELQLVLNLHRK